VQHNYFNNC
jgi:hypothetical protein